MSSAKDKIWASALKVIERRMVSSAELERKLKERFPDDEGLVPEVMGELERLQLIDDRRYAEQLVRHLTQKAIGRLKVRNEARRRGIGADLADEMLMAQDYHEAEFARRALEQKEKTLKEADPRRRKHKCQQFLRSRGFTDAVIYEVL